MKTLTYLLAATMLAACSSIDEPAPAPMPDDESVSGFTFSIYLDSGDETGSRAPQDGEYNPGAGYENYIDIAGGDFRVILYDTGNNWLATVDDPMLVPLGDDFESAKRYLLKCDLTEETANAINANGALKLVVLANWRQQYPAAISQYSLSELFDHVDPIDYSATLPGPVLAKSDKIAMFGVNQYDAVELKPNILKNLGTLHLLRALAKIEVWDSEETTQQMESVSITRHKTAAAPMPRNVLHQNDYVKNSYSDDYVTYPSFPTSWNYFDNESNIPALIEQGADGHHIIYVPEFYNKNRPKDSDRARLCVSYPGHDPYYIEFLDDNGERIDILRNYWYRFEVRKKIDEIKVTVQVVPYAEYDLRPGFGLEVDTDRYIPITIEEKDLEGNVKEKTIYYDPKTGIYYDTDKKTPIANPYPGLDAVTGRGIISDQNFNVLYYYDYTAGQYYGPDNSNKIVDPYCNDSYNVATGITDVKTVDGGRYYYYRAYDCRFFAPTNKAIEVIPEVLKDGEISRSGQLKFTEVVTGKITFYNVLTGRFYSDEAMTTPIADPFNV